MMRSIAMAAALLFMGACVEKSTVGEKKAPEKKKTAKPKPPPKPTVAREKPAPKPPAPPPENVPTRRATPEFCKKVFSVQVAEKLLGLKGMKPTPKAVARIRPGQAQCDYWVPPNKGEKLPRASVGMRVDCRPVHLTRERLLSAVKNRKHEKVGDRIYMRNPKLHSMWAWSKKPKCMVSVTTGGLKQRKVDKVIDHILSKLNPATAPK
jgi:hypothetical protein